jgi:hypothetical protein
MALNLSTTGIADGQVITAAQITQSIDALTGAAAYNITISGSFALGTSTTGSGTYNRSLRAQSVEISSLGVNNNYTIPYLSSTGSTTANIVYSGTSPTYNPVTETLKATNFQGTASFCASSSLAQTASYWNGFATKLAPNYTAIDSTTYTASVNPYSVNGTTAKAIIYVSQSLSNVLGIQLTPSAIVDGQIVTFIPQYTNDLGLDPSKISISASISDVFGFNSSNISPAPPTNNALLSTLLPSTYTGGNLNSFSFQYIATPIPPYMQAGWYLYNLIKA